MDLWDAGFVQSTFSFIFCQVFSGLFWVSPGLTALWTGYGWQACAHPSLRTFHLHSGCGYRICGEFMLLSYLFHLSGGSVKPQVARWPSLCPCYWTDTWTTVKPSGSLPAVAANLLVFMACVPRLVEVPWWQNSGCGWGERCHTPALFLLKVHS